MFRHKQVSWAVIALFTGGFVTSVVAQEQKAQTLERVEITGSRIKRVNAETSSPVQIITREQIERSGATSVTEVLKSIPANNAGAFDENAVASFTPGAGGVSLRGLGAQATLVLINGRRVAPFGFASGGQQTFVNVNSIPLETVERIETLLDGASAIYGSDAIAGVVNIILRKDYSGLMISGSAGQSSYSDAAGGAVSLTYGKGSLASDKYNVFANVSHNQRDPVKASERPTTASSDFRRLGLTDLRSSYAYPGNLYALPSTSSAGGAFVATLAGCTPLAEAGAAANGRCIYQGTDHQDIIAKTQQDSLFVSGVVDLGGGLELFSDLSLTRTKYQAESPSYSSSTYFSTGTLPAAYITLPIGHPQNPSATSEVGLRYRFMDVLHNTSVQSDTQRMVFGGRALVAGWEAESAFVYSHSATDVITTGLLNDSVLLNEVLDADGKARPTFIFGNPAANDPGLMSRLYPTLHDEGKTSTTSLDIRGTRELMQLEAGSLSLAVGLETRRESFDSTPDALTASGALSVLGSSSSNGSRSVNAAYAELAIPITKSIEASLAARTDRYSDFGAATTPKVGFKWKALPNLALRGTYAEGFRAPSLTELSQSPVRGFYTGIRDPKTCSDPADVTNVNCNLSVEAISGSNPNLQPEKSKSLTAGVVFEPADNFSIIFDAYRIRRKEEISSIDIDYLLANEAQFPGYVIRNAAGEIDHVNLQYTNLGSTQVWGYDIETKTTVNAGEHGKLGFLVAYNKLPRYLVANVKDAPEVDYAGTYLQPKERFKFGVNYDNGPWASTITWNYVGGYLRAFTPSDLSCSYSNAANELCSVPSWMTADVFVGYTGFKNLSLGLSINNIDNRGAPIDERRAARYTLFNSAYHNQLGRYMSLRGKYTFW